MSQYETLEVSVENAIAHVQLNRPEKLNAMNEAFWREIPAFFQWADQTPEVRAVIMSANGRHFSAGIDLGLLANVGAGDAQTDAPRRREAIFHKVHELQASFIAIEKCRKPVLAAIHGGCIGGGVDMVSACDMRYATEDAYFTIKEIQIGMTADVGTLQRLPRLIPEGVMREMAYTGRQVFGPEAKEIGLVNRTFASKEEMLEEVRKVAEQIVKNSPLAVRGTKEMLLYTRDHSTADALNYIAVWNAGMLPTNDMQEAFKATMEKREPVYSD